MKRKTACSLLLHIARLEVQCRSLHETVTGVITSVQYCISFSTQSGDGKWEEGRESAPNDVD